jgi:hypothetical protein
MHKSSKTGSGRTRVCRSKNANRFHRDDAMVDIVDAKVVCGRSQDILTKKSFLTEKSIGTRCVSFTPQNSYLSSICTTSFIVCGVDCAGTSKFEISSKCSISLDTPTLLVCCASMATSRLQSRIRLASSKNGRGTGTGSSRTVYTGEKFRDWCLWQGRLAAWFAHTVCVSRGGRLLLYARNHCI